MVFVLVAANGFFVAAEFSLVAVRRSRVAELVAAGRATRKSFRELLTISMPISLPLSLALRFRRWLSAGSVSPHSRIVIEPFLSRLLGSFAAVGAHAIAVAVAFIIITALHIVLGELAPKSLALQRSEATALRVVRPLGVFLFLLRPVIVALNGLGNLVLRLCGLRPGTVEESLHSPEELKLLIAASQEGGLLQEAQQEVVERVLNIGDRRISDIMTPRVDVDWIDINDDREEILRSIRECRHGQLLVGKGSIDEPLGMILKRDLLDQVLDGQPLDPMAVIRQPLVVHEAMRIFKVLEQFKRAPVRLATIVNEYGGLEGIVTQTDLLEAIAGDLAELRGKSLKWSNARTDRFLSMV